MIDKQSLSKEGWELLDTGKMPIKTKQRIKLKNMLNKMPDEKYLNPEQKLRISQKSAKEKSNGN